MASDREIEGTPAEATWAMLTVLIIIIVVIIFCCLLPFYRALEKRWHHWDDLGNDPRWDVENFQFSPTSPQMTRDPKYNRLSVCSTDNGSSMGTSSSGINRGDSFKNNCVLPRFADQVEFKLPPSYDDLFSKGSPLEEEGSETNISDTEELVKDHIVEAIPPPAKEPEVKKIVRKQQPKPSPPTSVTANSPPAQKPIPGLQEKKIQKNVSPNHSTGPVKPATKTPSKTESIPSSIAKPKSAQPSKTSTQPPAPPTKRNSIVLPKTTPAAMASQPPSSQPAPAPTAPVKKTYKKIKKTVPTDGTVKSE
eukprot:TRINITY_DN21230_c0_g1_i1.p1 TRINITY_DN21230_c0_g1~~TRINITY_DN21230_c0_g1_i1.p1  ORF type:complete len:307 (-),score=93.34 TRINITY_DN21230_c0_g1_i1:119-1039(-)